MIACCCDFCNKPLEFEDGRYIFHRARDVNIRALFPCLCENCAGKLNDICEVLDVGSSRRAEVLERNQKINKARRVQLGTKG